MGDCAREPGGSAFLQRLIEQTPAGDQVLQHALQPLEIECEVGDAGDRAVVQRRVQRRPRRRLRRGREPARLAGILIIIVIDVDAGAGLDIVLQELRPTASSIAPNEAATEDIRQTAGPT